MSGMKEEVLFGYGTELPGGWCSDGSGGGLLLSASLQFEWWSSGEASVNAVVYMTHEDRGLWSRERTCRLEL